MDGGMFNDLTYDALDLEELFAQIHKSSFLNSSSKGFQGMTLLSKGHNMTAWNSSSMDLLLLGTESKMSIFRIMIHYMDLYIVPLVALVGVVGNVLSFIVFVCTFMRRLSSSIYLAALALADLGFLLCVLVSWASNMGLDIYTQNGWCQSFMYLTYVSSFLSVWYVVSFTAERYIAVHFPLQRQGLCTTRRAKILVSVLAMASLVLYSFGIWTSGVFTMYSVLMCGPLPKYMNFVNVANNLDTIITLILPFLAILIMNVRIAYKVAKFYKERRHVSLRTSFTTTHSQSSSSHNSRRGHLSHTIVIQINTGSNSSALYTRTQVRVTKMLLTVSSIFLLLNLPHHSARVYTFIMTLTNDKYQPTANYIAWEKLFKFLYYFQFSINLFLYSAFGKNFRKALCLLGKRIRHKFEDLYARSPFWKSRPLFRATQQDIALREYRHISTRESRYI